MTTYVVTHSCLVADEPDDSDFEVVAVVSSKEEADMIALPEASDLAARRTSVRRTPTTMQSTYTGC
jgi:hypothetical protein